MSSPPTVGLIRRAWFNWKALKLPWRKKFLIGFDLSGASYWEFKDTLSSNSRRMRRIVEYPSSLHYSEVKISPQWHQWLRHTRADAPSLAEQSQDLLRQANLKRLAAEADARWAAKASVLDAPNKQQRLPATNVQDALPTTDGADTDIETPKTTNKENDAAWRRARAGGPSEEWTPQAWNPNATAESSKKLG